MRLVAEANACVVERMSKFFTRCLRDSRISTRWKRARLVLLRNKGKAEGLPSSYRPLCLLNEQEKFFERIVKDRMEEHMRGWGKINYPRTSLGLSWGNLQSMQ